MIGCGLISPAKISDEDKADKLLSASVYLLTYFHVKLCTSELGVVERNR